MKRRDYRTITGRTLELSGLGDKERNFLGIVQRKYTQGPEWSEFAGWWGEEFRRAHAQVYPVNKGAKLIFGNGELAQRYMLDRGGCAYFPLRAVHQHLQEGRLHIVPKGAEFSVPVFLSRSPLAQFEDWFDAALDALAAFGCRHNDMNLDTIPFADWEGLATS